MDADHNLDGIAHASFRMTVATTALYCVVIFVILIFHQIYAVLSTLSLITALGVLSVLFLAKPRTKPWNGCICVFVGLFVPAKFSFSVYQSVNSLISSTTDDPKRAQLANVSFLGQVFFGSMIVEFILLAWWTALVYLVFPLPNQRPVLPKLLWMFEYLDTVLYFVCLWSYVLKENISSWNEVVFNYFYIFISYLAIWMIPLPLELCYRWLNKRHNSLLGWTLLRIGLMAGADIPFVFVSLVSDAYARNIFVIADTIFKIFNVLKVILLVILAGSPGDYAYSSVVFGEPPPGEVDDQPQDEGQEPGLYPKLRYTIPLIVTLVALSLISVFVA